MYVEKTTSDGKSTLKAIIENDFAAAVIYLGLPGNDGLWVLEELKKLNICSTKIIAVNNIKNRMFSELAVNSGADYCLVEPFDMEIVKSRILQLCSVNNFRRQEETNAGAISLTEIISRIGIRPGLKGYCYLKYAVSSVIEDPQMISGITKRLYPEIAAEFKTQPKCVERDIRHCISVSWETAKDEYRRIFGYEFYKKPTNKELIHTLAEYIKDFSSFDRNIRMDKRMGKVSRLKNNTFNYTGINSIALKN